MAVLQILLTLGYFCFIQADYYISPATYDRENARDVCRLATPEILFPEEGNTVVLNTTQFPAGEKLWVGFALELTTFLYIGCSSPDDIKDNANMSIIYKKDLGQCYSFCKTRFFGMQESNCYCINSPPKNVGSKKCQSTCDIPKDTLCGQRGNEKDVSVYMKVNDTSDIESNGHYCQAVQRSSADSNFSWSYLWEACDKVLQFICQNGPFTESSQLFTSTAVEGNWHKSMASCISFRQYPAEKIDNIDQVIVSDIKKRWIGKIRSFVMKKTEDNSNLNHLDVHQGYIERDNDTVLLKFDPSFEDPLHALCEREHGTTLTSTPKSTGGSIGGNAWLWAVVVVVILLIRRYCNELLLPCTILLLLWCCCKRRQPGGKTDENITNTVTNVSYSEGNVRHKTSGNEYAIVDVAKNNATVNDEYDTTTNMQAKANVTWGDTGNEYNKLEDLNEDTYNHTNAEVATVEGAYDKTKFDEHESAYSTVDN